MSTRQKSKGLKGVLGILGILGFLECDELPPLSNVWAAELYVPGGYTTI